MDICCQLTEIILYVVISLITFLCISLYDMRSCVRVEHLRVECINFFICGLSISTDSEFCLSVFTFLLWK